MRKTIRVSKILKNLDPETYKMLRFALYAFIIFTTSMVNAVLTEKMYKTPYIRNDNEDGKEAASDYFKNPFGMALFNSFFALSYGFFMYEIMEHNSGYRQENGNRADKQFIKLSIVDLLIDLLLGLIIILTSFTVVNLINCAKLLAVVMFAVFFSSSSSHNKVEKRQIFVAGLICVGIIIFNVFGNHDNSSVNKPFDIWTSLLMIFILILEGYRPELASQIREKYSPPPSLMYYQVAKYSFIFLTAISIVTTKGWDLINFLWSHDRLALDLMVIAILEVIGTIFVYRITMLHQQHVMPMISTVRKLSTSVFNIYYFHHQIAGMQYLGLLIVAITLLTELYISYKVSAPKFNSIKAEEPYMRNDSI